MKKLILLFTLLAVGLSVFATQADSLGQSSSVTIEVTNPDFSELDAWDKANTAYINGNYAEAIALYNSIEEQGLSSDLFYFNLGNAHYKNNDIARAILYYQKALLLSPSDEDIKYNLSVAQGQIRDQIEEIPEFFLRRWNRAISRSLSSTGWSILSLISLVVLLSALLVFLLSRPIAWRKIGFSVGVVAAVVLWFSTIYALSSRRELLEHNTAVIMSQSISIKSSPDRSATDLFMLHSGTTVKIGREIEGWYEIVIADGKKGWIESRRVEKI